MTPQLDPKQLLSATEYAVYELRQLHKFSLRQTALALDRSPSTIVDTERRIRRKLRRAA